MNGLGLIVIVGVLAVVWVLMIRPQRRRQTAQSQMLSNLAIGDEILTAGGIYGTVDSIESDEVSVEIAPGTKIRVAKRAVAAVLTEHEEVEDADGAPPESSGENPPPAEENPG